MTVYQPLQDHLLRQDSPAVTMTYAEIEKLLGRPLPPTAYGDKRRQWWANTETHSQALAWLRAKRKAKLDVVGKKVTFIRQDESEEPKPQAARSISLDLGRLDPAAMRILEDVAEGTGGDLSGALLALLNEAGRRRRQNALDWFAANSGPKSAKSSVELIREDRDAR